MTEGLARARTLLDYTADKRIISLVGNRSEW
jgi:hypothetical protein